MDVEPVEGPGGGVVAEPLQKPGTISGLVYLANPFSRKGAVGGPWRLGNDEYFVLGDFSRLSGAGRSRAPTVRGATVAICRNHDPCILAADAWRVLC